MRKTASEVRQQAEKLAAQSRALEEKARELEAAEARGVAERIREAIEHYKFSVDDLFGPAAKKPGRSAHPVRAAKPAEGASGVAPATNGSTHPARTRTKNQPKKPVSVLKGQKVPIKYRDADGNEWSGRGSQPRWLTQALAGGKPLQDFTV